MSYWLIDLTPRALQFPPEAWLRLSLQHGSITWLSVQPSGRVTLRSLGDTGHMPPTLLTTSWPAKPTSTREHSGKAWTRVENKEGAVRHRILKKTRYFFGFIGCKIVIVISFIFEYFKHLKQNFIKVSMIENMRPYCFNNIIITNNLYTVKCNFLCTKQNQLIFSFRLIYWLFSTII